MILQSLVDYYQLLLESNNTNLPKRGYSEENAHFCLVINEKGELRSIRDLRTYSDQKKSSKLVPIKLTLPERVQKTSGITSNCFWENAEYALGIALKQEDKQHKTRERFQYFYNLHRNLLKDITDMGAVAFLLFLEKHSMNNCQNDLLSKYVDDFKKGAILVFRLEGDTKYLHERKEIKKAWEQYYRQKEGQLKGVSLLSGKIGAIAENHATIKGVKDAQSSGARIVSFNSKAFESYGHRNGRISPITEEEMFQYTTVLNYLLSSKRQRIQIGDATTVFWSKTPDTVQTDLFFALLTGGDFESKVSENERVTEIEHETKVVHSVLKGIQNGNFIDMDRVEIERNTEFYILGLSPNNARLSIRYFYRTSFGDMINHITQHYQDTVVYTNQTQHALLTPWRMLNETAVNEKTHPLLGGALIQAVLNGVRYPTMFYQQVLLRIRAKQDVNYYKAASIKGYLVRKARFEKNEERERMITVALNDERADFAYLFGRLFAVLENVQVTASPQLERTLRSSYFSRASTAPKMVFSTLLRLNQHHQDKVAKEKKGLQVNYDRIITSILGRKSTIPAQLNLEEQGDFMLGYYQQKQEIYIKGDR